MQRVRGQFLLVFFVLFPLEVRLLENGLARTPPMGWMSWGYYACGTQCKKDPDKCLDEKLILEVVDTFFTEGYQEAGYEYIIIDDCWSEKKRDIKGRLVADKERFPRGMKYIADYIHSRGLKFGMYTNIAPVTCMLYPGSEGYFRQDAQTFADWGVDYLKVDGCFVKEDYLNTAYIDLGKALNRTGRPMIYSCSWPYYKQFIHHKIPEYAPVMKHCNLWRNYHDVFLNWPSVEYIIKYFAEEYESLAPFHGPGHWNDPDMLIFGTNTLTPGQSRIQLVVYAMMSAPLLLSCDMKKITPYEKQLLQNLDLIAIAQDPLGIMAKPYPMSHSLTLYVKKHLPMKGDIYHSVSFAMVNLGLKEEMVHVTPGDYDLNSPDGYSVMNVLTKDYFLNVTINDYIHAAVAPQGRWFKSGSKDHKDVRSRTIHLRFLS